MVAVLSQEDLKQCQQEVILETVRILTGIQTDDWKKTRNYTIEDFVTQFKEFEYLNKGKVVGKNLDTTWYMKKIRGAARKGELGTYDRFGNIMVTYNEMCKYLFNKK